MRAPGGFHGGPVSLEGGPPLHVPLISAIAAAVAANAVGGPSLSAGPSESTHAAAGFRQAVVRCLQARPAEQQEQCCAVAVGPSLIQLMLYGYILSSASSKVRTCNSVAASLPISPLHRNGTACVCSLPKYDALPSSNTTLHRWKIYFSHAGGLCSCLPARSPMLRRQGLGWPVCLFSLLLLCFKMRSAVQVLRLRTAWLWLRMLLLCGTSLAGRVCFRSYSRSCAWGLYIC